jgi:type IV fimbrial biogenesis protein FimT
MVTLVVAAVVVTVGIPSLRDLLRDNRITTQTNELVTALNLARAEALKRGRAVEVVIETRASGWFAAVSVQGSDQELRVIDRAGSAVSLDAGATIVFFPTGIPSSTPSFTIEPAAGCSRTQRRQVAIAPSGQITTARLACA